MLSLPDLFLRFFHHLGSCFSSGSHLGLLLESSFGWGISQLFVSEFWLFLKLLLLKLLLLKVLLFLLLLLLVVTT